MVPGDEIAARVPDDRHAQFLDLPRDVRPEPVRVGETRTRLMDARVNRAPEMLEKRAEKAPIEVQAAGRAAEKRPRRTASHLAVAHREP
jgi:hypothetical protein